MGRSYTPEYVLEMPDLGMTPVAWYVRGKPSACIRGMGKPTTAAIEKYVRDFIDSQKPGGPNAHLARPHVLVPNRAFVRVNKVGGPIVAEWRAPMFMAI